MTLAVKPYLSLVATARNDNHGGNMLERMQAFVNGIMQQSLRHGVQTELILVEWNPPEGNAPLRDAIDCKCLNERCTLRIIEVPREVHARYAHAEALPLYQMIAKNVGIRRAQGEFILATNIDILFSEDLFAFFAQRKLEKNVLYRLDRYDVREDFPFSADILTQLEFCKRNILRINGKYGVCNLATGNVHRIYPEGAQGIFNGRTVLHTNACGDFTLLSKDNWQALRGYPELDTFSFHLDSLFCYMAHHSGAKERILEHPLCIYHIEHKAGWTPETERDRTLKKKLSTLSIPEMPHAEFETYAIRMTATGEPIIFNDNNWGHALENLPETVSPPAMPSPYLSIIVTARNDNHGGDMLHRLQTFINFSRSNAAYIPYQRS